MKIWKEVIRPATYFYKDAAGKKQKLQVTPAMVQHMAKTGEGMLSANLSIPVPLEHQPTALPIDAADEAANQLLNNAGWVRKYKLLKDNVLMALHEITDAEVQKKIRDKSCAFTSPKIEGKFMDGNGKEWTNAITHHALTLRPRITKQTPFGAKVLLSINSAPLAVVKDAIPGGSICLSTAGLLEQDAKSKKWQPKNAAMFAMDNPDEEMDEMEVDPKDGMIEEDVQIPEEPEPTVTEDGDVDSAKLISDLLESLFGVKLDANVSKDTLCRDIVKGLMDHLKSKNMAGDLGAEMGMDEDMMDSGLGAGEIVQEQQPLYMSLTTIHPTITGVAKRLIEDKLKTANIDREKRISALAKKAPAVKNSLMEKAATAVLSINSQTGEIKDPLAYTLSLLEKMPSSDPLTRATAAGKTITAQEHPSDSGNGMTKARHKQVMAAFIENTEIPAAK